LARAQVDRLRTLTAQIDELTAEIATLLATLTPRCSPSPAAVR
jgi:hypothetical protein